MQVASPQAGQLGDVCVRSPYMGIGNKNIGYHGNHIAAPYSVRKLKSYKIAAQDMAIQSFWLVHAIRNQCNADYRELVAVA